MPIGMFDTAERRRTTISDLDIVTNGSTEDPVRKTSNPKTLPTTGTFLRDAGFAANVMPIGPA